MTQPVTSVESPCIRNCCLDQTDMCVGCFRMLDEILIWGNTTKNKQLAILSACAKRRSSQFQSDNN